MKKVLSIIALLLIGMKASAQVETLTRTVVEADPMTNTSGGVEWSSEHVCISLPDKGLSWIILGLKDHIFVKRADTKIGYYTSDDKLIGMGLVIGAQVAQDGTYMMIGGAFSNDSLPHSIYYQHDILKTSWRVRVKDVVEWLKETDGYIRIVTETYGNHLYDVKFRLKKEE